MFRRISRMDELFRRGLRPNPIASVFTDVPNDEEHAAQKSSHLGPTARFKGDISLDENLCIEGEIEGTITIRGKQLSISNKALVKGGVHARTIEVRGTVEGDVHGEELVHLYSTAAITGSVYCKRIIVDDGARFDGLFQTSREVAKSSDAKKAPKAQAPEDKLALKSVSA